jgi:hypothetical protein
LRAGRAAAAFFVAAFFAADLSDLSAAPLAEADFFFSFFSAMD